MTFIINLVKYYIYLKENYSAVIEEYYPLKTVYIHAILNRNTELSLKNKTMPSPTNTMSPVPAPAATVPTIIDENPGKNNQPIATYIPSNSPELHQFVHQFIERSVQIKTSSIKMSNLFI